MDFNEFKKKYFQDDLEQCLRHLVNESYYCDYSLTGSRDNLQKLLDQLDRPTAAMFMRYFKEAVKKDKSKFRNDNKDLLEMIGPKLSFSYDEVKNAKVNPYKSKLSSAFLKSLVAGGGLISYALIAQSMGLPGLMNDFGSTLVTMLSAYMATNIGINLVNYFKFKKAKSDYEKENSVENNKGGRRL